MLLYDELLEKFWLLMIASKLDANVEFMSFFCLLTYTLVDNTVGLVDLPILKSLNAILDF